MAPTICDNTELGCELKNVDLIEQVDDNEFSNSNENITVNSLEEADSSVELNTNNVEQKLHKQMPWEGPPAQGLYNPENEHEACGVGFIVAIDGKRSHKVNM